MGKWIEPSFTSLETSLYIEHSQILFWNGMWALPTVWHSCTTPGNGNAANGGWHRWESQREQSTGCKLGTSPVSHFPFPKGSFISRQTCYTISATAKCISWSPNLVHWVHDIRSSHPRQAVNCDLIHRIAGECQCLLNPQFRWSLSSSLESLALSVHSFRFRKHKYFDLQIQRNGSFSLIDRTPSIFVCFWKSLTP